MEEEIKEMHSEIKELCKAVNRISQFATVIANGLSSHDEKLNQILSKITPSKVTFSQEVNQWSQKLENPSLTKSEITSKKIKTKPEEIQKIRDGIDVPQRTEHGSSPCTSEDASTSNAAKTYAATSLPYNLSTPSIPMLNVEKVTKFSFSNNCLLEIRLSPQNALMMSGQAFLLQYLRCF